MARRSAFKQADVSRALKGAAGAGMKPSGCRIDPITGAIELTFGRDDAAPQNSFDALMVGRR